MTIPIYIPINSINSLSLMISHTDGLVLYLLAILYCIFMLYSFTNISKYSPNPQTVFLFK